jgi:Sulfatase
MSHNLKSQILYSLPWFLFLLPVFFVFHGSNEHFGFIPFSDAMQLILVYTAVAVAGAFIIKFLLRKKGLAALFVLAVMSFFLFFGSLHDWLKKILGSGSLFYKYSFLIPAFLLLLAGFTFWLYKKPGKISCLTKYFNLLFLLLILAESFFFVRHSVNTTDKHKLPAGITACNDCDKPDIYLLLFDEYAGSVSLKQKFNFDNSKFETQLKEKGFYVFKNSVSNYNYTAFSIASLLNMEYLDIDSSISGHNGSAIGYCYSKIKYSTVKNFFEQSGYRFINYSIFDFKGSPAPQADEMLPVKTKLITRQTLLHRAKRDLWFNLLTRFKSKKAIRSNIYFNLRNNKNILKLTKQETQNKQALPRFIYSHIRMPHFPYYFDSSGAEQPYEKLSEIHYYDTALYLDYLQYTNRQIIELIDLIKKNSSKPPVIILMSDHGFRMYPETADKTYIHHNLNAIYYPGGNYASFPESISAVNQYRLILNTRFKQNLEMLKDSTIFLSD